MQGADLTCAFSNFVCAGGAEEGGVKGAEPDSVDVGDSVELAHPDSADLGLASSPGVDITPFSTASARVVARIVKACKESENEVSYR